MSETAKKSRLAEWGSRSMTTKDKVLLSLGGLLLVVVVGAIWLWATTSYGDDVQDLEDQLNSRYEETISVGVQQVNGQSQETFTVDGVNRPDCDDTPDGYLECSDDPQPTPQGQ